MFRQETIKIKSYLYYNLFNWDIRYSKIIENKLAVTPNKNGEFSLVYANWVRFEYISNKNVFVKGFNQ